MYADSSGSSGGGAGLLLALFLVAWLLTALPLWFIFKKAGKAGWAALIPIYNIVVLLEIVGRPVWWLVLLIIPFMLVGAILSYFYERNRSIYVNIGIHFIFNFLSFMLLVADATSS